MLTIIMVSTYVSEDLPDISTGSNFHLQQLLCDLRQDRTAEINVLPKMIFYATM